MDVLFRGGRGLGGSIPGEGTGYQQEEGSGACEAVQCRPARGEDWVSYVGGFHRGAPDWGTAAPLRERRMSASLSDERVSSPA